MEHPVILKAYAIHDNKTEAYLKPFFCVTPGEAIRIFSDAVNDQNSMFYRHPADFTLFEVGTYNDEHGLLDSNVPSNLGSAIQYKTPGDTSHGN